MWHEVKINNCVQIKWDSKIGEQNLTCKSGLTYQDGDPVFDVADEHHAVDLVGLLALLVDEREVDVQPVSDGSHSKY